MGTQRDTDDYRDGYNEGKNASFIDSAMQGLNFLDGGSPHDKGFWDGTDDKGSSSGDSGSSGGGSSGGGGDSCCYVTTACLDALSLPRDSLELRAMKILTKNHILKTFRGKRDYVLYQRKGPRIVQAIESREDSQNIWRGIYDKLMNVTASILSRDYEKGHQQYKELILGLERQFC